MAGSIIRGDQSWFKATRAWLKLVDDILPRLPQGSRAAKIVRVQKDSTVYYLNLTDESADTIADIRRAVVESRERFLTMETTDWDMPFSVETFTEAIDELIAMLGD
jgi:hypothetical protein